MRRLGLLAMVSAMSVTACAQLLDIPDVHDGNCSPDAAFTAPSPVPGLGTAPVQSAQLSRDELTIVFSRIIDDGLVVRNGDLYLAHRDHLGDAFRDATALDDVNTELDEFSASLSDDLRTLYFDREVEDRRYEILVASRSSTEGVFGKPAPISLGAPDSSNFEPFITAQGLYFGSTRRNGLASLFLAPGGGTSFEAPSWLRQLETQKTPTAYETPVVAGDGLTIYFGAAADGEPTKDIWLAQRPAADEPFEAPHAVTSVNTTAHDSPSWISPDGCHLYFTTDRSGVFALWMASRRTP
jgi:hypothetical protein